eukprot:5532108-Prymnesium_polylepis.1
MQEPAVFFACCTPKLGSGGAPTPLWPTLARAFGVSKFFFRRADRVAHSTRSVHEPCTAVALAFCFQFHR